MRHSEQLDKLAAALSKFQGEISDVEKDSENTFFKDAKGKPSGYASLAAYLQQARPLLAKHGLSVAQFPDTIEGKPALSTMLMHASGQYIAAEAILIVDKNNMQGVGSATSYQRRFSFGAVTGMTSIDDDGNEASRQETPLAGAPRPAVKAQVAPASTQSQTQPAPAQTHPPYILALVDSAKAAKIKKADLEHLISLRYPDVKSVYELSQAQCATLVQDILKVPPAAITNPVHGGSPTAPAAGGK